MVQCNVTTARSWELWCLVQLSLKMSETGWVTILDRSRCIRHRPAAWRQPVH